MLRRGCILVVDNEPAIADLFVDILTDAGYAALSASDASSAFWLIVNYAPALLLLDLHLRDLPGRELIAQLHGIGVTAMPIVLMSTQPHHAERQRLEAYPFLVKPFDINEMLTCVARYVQPIGAGASERMRNTAGSGFALIDNNRSNPTP